MCKINKLVYATGCAGSKLKIYRIKYPYSIRKVYIIKSSIFSMIKLKNDILVVGLRNAKIFFLQISTGKKIGELVGH